MAEGRPALTAVCSSRKQGVADQQERRRTARRAAMSRSSRVAPPLEDERDLPAHGLVHAVTHAGARGPGAAPTNTSSASTSLDGAPPCGVQSRDTSSASGAEPVRASALPGPSRVPGAQHEGLTPAAGVPTGAQAGGGEALLDIARGQRCRRACRSRGLPSRGAVRAAAWAASSPAGGGVSAVWAGPTREESSSASRTRPEIEARRRITRTFYTAGHDLAGGGGWARAIAIAVAVALLLLLAHLFDARAWLAGALEWIRELGPWGPVAFACSTCWPACFFCPARCSPWARARYSAWATGLVVVSISATLGATAAFLVGRYVARGWVERTIATDPRFRAIDLAVEHEGWKIVGLLRLSPVVPFNLLNYAFGVTRVRLRDYVVASWAGMLPGTVLYVYLGSLAGHLAVGGGAGRTRSPAEWTFYAVGSWPRVAVTVYVTRVARGRARQAGGGMSAAEPVGTEPVRVQPWDAHNQALVANVHPPGWVNPTPAPRYNLVVLGAGTAGLVTAAGAAGLGAKVALVERASHGRRLPQRRLRALEGLDPRRAGRRRRARRVGASASGVPVRPRWTSAR